MSECVRERGWRRVHESAQRTLLASESEDMNLGPVRGQGQGKGQGKGQGQGRLSAAEDMDHLPGLLKSKGKEKGKGQGQGQGQGRGQSPGHAPNALRARAPEQGRRLWLVDLRNASALRPDPDPDPDPDSETPGMKTRRQFACEEEEGGMVGGKEEREAGRGGEGVGIVERRESE